MKKNLSVLNPSTLQRVLLVLSFASGCAALIYEIVWFQLLQLVIGSSSVSLGVLLGTFMGGMCLGSVMLPRLISTKWNALRVCAALEMGIGLAGLFILFVLPEAEVIYSAHAGGNSAGIFLRALFASGCMLLPTVLMGATLPMMARMISSTRGVSRLGSIYGSNIIGAVSGCLLAGFYLLRVHDTVAATIFAAGLNAAIAVAAAGLSFFTRSQTPIEKQIPMSGGTASKTAKGKSVLPVYIVVALSGMTALGAEVIWTRLLSLMFGGTVYTFSIILAVFLIGLGAGSYFGSRMAQNHRRPELALGWCQLLLTAAIAWTAYMLMQSLPYWPDSAPSSNTWINFQIAFSRCLWGLLPATLLWGASFPLALAAASRGQDSARLFGNISAANTLGGIIGGIGFSVVLMPLQGMQYGQRLLIVLAAFAAGMMLLPSLLQRHQKFSLAFAVRAAVVGLALGILPVFSALSVSKVPGQLLAFGRSAGWLGNHLDLLYANEGQNYPVGVSQIWNSNVRVFHVCGKIEASTYVQDMRVQRMLGHLPALLHPCPESVLVVGCGAGVTAGSFTLYHDVKKITICELEPLVPQIADKFFSPENYGVLKDYRTQLVFDDARHYILTTTNHFDIITSDPIHPWVKGSANLYTKEYFELVRAHLNRGGIVTQWVPLYQSDSAVVKSELATFFEVFPNGTIWSSDKPGQGSDIILLGQYGRGQIDLDEAQQRLAEEGYSRVAQSLADVGFDSALDLFAEYSGRARDLEPWLQDAQINHDKDLRLQYLAGLTLQQEIGNPIYHQLLAFRKFPETLFVGSPQLKHELNERLQRPIH